MPRRPLAAANAAAIATLALLAGCARPTPPGAPEPAATPGAVPAGARAAAPATYRPGIDVLDYELTFDLPASGKRIEGRAVLTVHRTAPVDTLVLDLLAPMRVDSALVGGAPAAFGRDSATVRIPLPRGANDTLRVAVRYAGEPADGLIISTDSAGRWMAFGDNFPDRGRNWIPSVDHPSDKATVTWIVRTRAPGVVVANGELVEADSSAANGGGARRTVWRENRPVPVYVMVLAAAPLVRHELGETACGLAEVRRCVPQSVWVAPEVLDFLPGPFAQAGPIVEHFARLVAPFPYEKLDHVQSSTRFGGMENSTAIFYSDRAFRQRTLGVGLVAHEIAHQWFGDAVTEREWAHLWLSEGFATYFAAIWTEHAEGDSAFRSAMRQTRETVLRAPAAAERPVIDTAETRYLSLLNANSYQKGGFVLHMLRGLVGDSAFFRGVRSYYAAHRHGNALTDDLRREVERSSGQQLGWFFDQWLRRPGFAELTTGWRYDDGARRVVLDVEQGTRFGAYRFPLEVEIADAEGRTHRVRVEVPAERTSRHTLPLALDRPPRGVTLDPGVALLATFRER